VSLLLTHGHVHAQFYPIGMVWAEAAIVNRRTAAEEANRAVMLQSAVSSLFSEKAGSNFRRTLKDLRDED
jgi:hypothetical protein